jgi:uncharacterized protein
MKYALVFGLVLLVVWLWRSNRQKSVRDSNQNTAHHAVSQPGKQNPATEIVACAMCKVHLPRAEALTGKLGLYCSVAHRQQADH